MQKLKIFSLRELYLVAIFLMFNASFAFAQQIPHLITYKGDIKELARDDGKVDKDEKEKKDKDAYNLTFRIYNLEIGGAALWEETHLQTPVKKGNFEVILGSITPLDIRFDEDYWLSIEVDSEGEIVPRERWTSVGYAYMADDAWKLGGRLADEYAFTEHNHLGEDIITPVNEAINADMVDGLHAYEIGGIKDHGLLEGLADDDHLQYLNVLRGDERYAGAGWDGLTRLKTAQDHIVDLINPHAVTLEQLGHLDNNPEEEAPTATERGEPTGLEIQGWADDIAAWGHANLVTNLNADMLDGFHAASSSNPLPNTLLALDAEGKFPASVIPPITTPGLWTDADTYIYPNNAGSSFQITDNGNLFVNGKVGVGITNPLAPLHIGDVAVGIPTLRIDQADDEVGIRLQGDPNDGGLDIRVGHPGGGPSKIQGKTPDASGPYHLAINPDGGNVGIGIISPSEKLDVVGTVKLTGFKMPTGAVNGYVMTSDVNGAGSWQSATNGEPVAEAVNADKVDGLHASILPTANYLYPLNANAKFPASIIEGIVADADKLDGKDSTEFSLIGHFHTLMDITDVTSDLRAAFLAAGAAGASGANRIATMSDILVTPPPLGLWTDEGTYIYPNNVGSGLQIMDTGHFAVAGNAGIVDAQTANPKGTLTIGQSLAENNTDYSLVIARHGTNTNPGTYSHTAPALLVQDFAGTVPLSARDNDGIVRINAYRIGDTTPNAANATLFNVTNDQGEALRVDGLRNTFIGYGQKYTTSNQIGSLFVDGRVGIGTTNPLQRLVVNDGADGAVPGVLEVTGSRNTGGGQEAFISIRAVNTASTPVGNSYRFAGFYAGDGPGEVQADFAVATTATSSWGRVAVYTNHPLIFETNSRERMRITNTGDVGIGTTNPQSPLHVANAKVSLNLQDIEHLGSDPGYGSYIRFTDSAGEPVAYLGDGGSSMLMQFRTMIPGYRLAFGSGQNYQLVLDPSGNVGINTANPQAALDVNGDLSVNGPIYQRGSLLHADYVFEPNYQLESIDEHASYMWQEKHLKAVPKAAKAENGQEIVEVGARGKGVLEELEKAHIYIAQLNERIKKLEAKLEKQ